MIGISQAAFSVTFDLQSHPVRWTERPSVIDDAEAHFGIVAHGVSPQLTDVIKLCEAPLGKMFGSKCLSVLGEIVTW